MDFDVEPWLTEQYSTEDIGNWSTQPLSKTYGDVVSLMNFQVSLENVHGNENDWQAASDVSACQWSGDGTTFSITQMAFDSLTEDVYSYQVTDSSQEITAVDWKIGANMCIDDRFKYSVLETLDDEIVSHLNASIVNSGGDTNQVILNPNENALFQEEYKVYFLAQLPNSQCSVKQLIVKTEGCPATSDFTKELVCQNPTITTEYGSDTPTFDYEWDPLRIDYTTLLFESIDPFTGSECQTEHSLASVVKQDGDFDASWISPLTLGVRINNIEPKEDTKQGSYMTTVQGVSGCQTATQQFIVNIRSPCNDDTIIVDDSVFVDKEYVVGSEQYVYSWTDSIVSSGAGLDCGPISWQIWREEGHQELPSPPFTANTDSANKFVNLLTSDDQDVDAYDLAIRASYMRFPEVKSDITDFKVVVKEKEISSCATDELEIDTDNAAFNDITYTIGEGSESTSWGDDVVTSLNALTDCGNIVWTIIDSDTGVTPADPPFTTTITPSTRTIKVESNDLAHAKVYNLRATFQYEDYSTVQESIDIKVTVKEAEPCAEMVANPLTLPTDRSYTIEHVGVQDSLANAFEIVPAMCKDLLQIRNEVTLMDLLPVNDQSAIVFDGTTSEVKTWTVKNSSKGVYSMQIQAVDGSGNVVGTHPSMFMVTLVCSLPVITMPDDDGKMYLYDLGTTKVFQSSPFETNDNSLTAYYNTQVYGEDTDSTAFITFLESGLGITMSTTDNQVEFIDSFTVEVTATIGCSSLTAEFTVQVQHACDVDQLDIKHAKWSTIPEDQNQTIEVEYEIDAEKLFIDQFSYLNEISQCGDEVRLERLIGGVWENNDISIITFSELEQDEEGNTLFDVHVKTTDKSLDPSGLEPPEYKFRFVIGAPTTTDAIEPKYLHLNVVVKHPCRSTIIVQQPIDQMEVALNGLSAIQTVPSFSHSLAADYNCGLQTLFIVEDNTDSWPYSDILSGSFQTVNGLKITLNSNDQVQVGTHNVKAKILFVNFPGVTLTSDPFQVFIYDCGDNDFESFTWSDGTTLKAQFSDVINALFVEGEEDLSFIVGSSSLSSFCNPVMQLYKEDQAVYQQYTDRIVRMEPDKVVLDTKAADYPLDQEVFKIRVSLWSQVISIGAFTPQYLEIPPAAAIHIYFEVKFVHPCRHAIFSNNNGLSKTLDVAVVSGASDSATLETFSYSFPTLLPQSFSEECGTQSVSIVGQQSFITISAFDLDHSNFLASVSTTDPEQGRIRTFDQMSFQVKLDSYPEVEFIAPPFTVTINPNCQDLRLVFTPSDLLATMELDLGSNQVNTQLLPEITDQDDLLASDYCTLTMKLTVSSGNSDSQEVDWLAFDTNSSGNSIVKLSTPPNETFIKQHEGSLEIGYVGGTTDLQSIQFPISITGPQCETIRLTAPTDLNAMEIQFGSNEVKSQPLLQLTDEFGLLAMGLCSDIVQSVEIPPGADFLTLEEPSTGETSDQIKLVSPRSQNYITDNVAFYNVKYTYELDGITTTVTLFELEFIVTVHQPDCTDIRLIPSPMVDMEIEFGDEGDDLQPFTAVTDEFGLLEMGLCPITVSVILDGARVDFLRLTESGIVLTSPDRDNLIGPHIGACVIMLDATSSTSMLLLQMTEFDVTISSPDCHDIRMITSPDLSDIAIELGYNGRKTAIVSSLEDEHGLWDMGHCHAVMTIMLNGVTVPFLNLEFGDNIYNDASTVVLTTPPDNSLIGRVNIGKVITTLTSDGHVINERVFIVTINEPDCNDLQLNPITLLDMEIQFGSPTMVPQNLPALMTASGVNIFEMGYCECYFVLHETDRTSAIPNVSLMIDLAPMQLQLSSPPMFIPEVSGTLKALLVDNGVSILTTDPITFKVMEADCSDLNLISHSLSNMSLDLGSNREEGQSIPVLDDTGHILLNEFCHDQIQAVLTLDGNVESFFTMDWSMEYGGSITLRTAPVSFSLRTYPARLSYQRLDGSVLMNVGFNVEITSPNCNNLSLISPSAPNDMEINFAANQRKTRSAPSISDTFGLISAGYCDVSSDVKATKGSFTGTEYRNFLSLAANVGIIALIDPDDADYIGTWDAILTISVSGTTISPILLPFAVTIHEPDCDDLQLIEHTINTMTINLGETEDVLQEIQKLMDERNVFNSGFCKEEVSMILTFNGLDEDFFTVHNTADDDPECSNPSDDCMNSIMLKSPPASFPILPDPSMYPARLSYRLTDGTVLIDIDFQVAILEPICDNLILPDLTNPNDMEILFANLATIPQTLPLIQDEFGLIEIGYCSYMMQFTGRFAAADWDFFRLEDGKLLLETPTLPEYIGSFEALIEVTVQDTDIYIPPLELQVTVHPPNCKEMVINAPAQPLAPMSIKFASNNSKSQQIPRLEDEFGLLSMGFCSLTMTAEIGGALERRELRTLGRRVSFLNASNTEISLRSPSIADYPNPDESPLGNPQEATLKVMLEEDSHEMIDLPFEVTINPPDCRRLTLTETRPLNHMEITIGKSMESQNKRSQFVPPFRDSFGLIKNNYCIELYMRVHMDGMEEIPSWVELNEETIDLIDPISTQFIGRHQSELQLVFPIDVIGTGEASQDQPTSDIVLGGRRFDIDVFADLPFLEPEEDIVVEFVGIGSSVLTPWTVKPNVRMSYNLPAVSHPEEIQIALAHAQDSGELEKCQCYNYIPALNQARILVPNDWDRDVQADTLQVVLSYRDQTKIYTIPLIIILEDLLLQPLQGPFQQATRIQRLDANVWLDEPDLNDEGSDLEFYFPVDETKCLPLYARTNSAGQISVVFNHPIEFTYADTDFAADAIVTSGGIQVQLLSVIKPESELRAQYSWKLSLKDEVTMVFQVTFNQPEEISSNGVDRDQFRIYFVDTGAFVQCKAAQVISLGQNRRAQGGRALQTVSTATSTYATTLSVPGSTVVRVELPPQLEVIDVDGEEAKVTFYQGSEDAATDSLIISLGVARFLSIPSEILYNGLLSVQVVSHMPLLNVNFPRSELDFMTYLNKIVSFHKYDPNDFIVTGFSDTPPFKDNFEWLQYNTSNFYQNLGAFLLLLSLMILRQCFLAPLCFTLSRLPACKCLKRHKRSLLLSIPAATNVWIRFIMVMFFELVIAAFTGLYLSDTIITSPNAWDKAAHGSARVVTFLIYLFPVMLLAVVIFKIKALYEHRMEEEEFDEVMDFGKPSGTQRQHRSNLVTPLDANVLIEEAMPQGTDMERIAQEFLQDEGMQNGPNDLSEQNQSSASDPSQSSNRRLPQIQEEESKYEYQGSEVHSSDASGSRSKSNSESDQRQQEDEENQFYSVNSVGRFENEDSELREGGENENQKEPQEKSDPPSSSRQLYENIVVEQIDSNPTESDQNSVSLDPVQQAINESEARIQRAIDESETRLSSVCKQHGYSIKPSSREQRRNLIQIVDHPRFQREPRAKLLDFFSDHFAGVKKKRHYAAFFVNLIHILRRIVFVLIAMGIHSQAWIQAICFVSIALLIMVYLIDVKPFESLPQNLLEIFNELMILLIGYHMILVTGFNIPNYHRTVVGYSAMFYICLLIFVNVSHCTYFFVQSFKLHTYKYLIHCRHRKTSAARAKKNKHTNLGLVSIETERGLMKSQRSMEDQPKFTAYDEMSQEYKRRVSVNKFDEDEENRRTDLKLKKKRSLVLAENIMVEEVDATPQQLQENQLTLNGDICNSDIHNDPNTHSVPTSNKDKKCESSEQSEANEQHDSSVMRQDAEGKTWFKDENNGAWYEQNDSAETNLDRNGALHGSVEMNGTVVDPDDEEQTSGPNLVSSLKWSQKKEQKPMDKLVRPQSSARPVKPNPGKFVSSTKSSRPQSSVQPGRPNTPAEPITGNSTPFASQNNPDGLTAAANINRPNFTTNKKRDRSRAPANQIADKQSISEQRAQMRLATVVATQTSRPDRQSTDASKIKSKFVQKRDIKPKVTRASTEDTLQVLPANSKPSRPSTSSIYLKKQPLKQSRPTTSTAPVKKSNQEASTNKEGLESQNALLSSQQIKDNEQAKEAWNSASKLKSEVKQQSPIKEQSADKQKEEKEKSDSESCFDSVDSLEKRLNQDEIDEVLHNPFTKTKTKMLNKLMSMDSMPRLEKNLTVKEIVEEKEEEESHGQVNNFETSQQDQSAKEQNTLQAAKERADRNSCLSVNSHKAENEDQKSKSCSKQPEGFSEKKLSQMFNHSINSAASNHSNHSDHSSDENPDFITKQLSNKRTKTLDVIVEKQANMNYGAEPKSALIKMPLKDIGRKSIVLEDTEADDDKGSLTDGLPKNDFQNRSTRTLFQSSSLLLGKNPQTMHDKVRSVEDHGSTEDDFKTDSEESEEPFQDIDEDAIDSELHNNSEMHRTTTQKLSHLMTADLDRKTTIKSLKQHQQNMKIPHAIEEAEEEEKSEHSSVLSSSVLSEADHGGELLEIVGADDFLEKLSHMSHRSPHSNDSDGSKAPEHDEMQYIGKGSFVEHKEKKQPMRFDTFSRHSSSKLSRARSVEDGDQQVQEVNFDNSQNSWENGVKTTQKETKIESTIMPQKTEKERSSSFRSSLLNLPKTLQKFRSLTPKQNKERVSTVQTSMGNFESVQAESHDMLKRTSATYIGGLSGLKARPLQKKSTKKWKPENVAEDDEPLETKSAGNGIDSARILALMKKKAQVQNTYASSKMNQRKQI